LFSPYLSAGQIDRVVAIAKTDVANCKSTLYGQIDDIKARLHSAGSGEPTATQGQRSVSTQSQEQGVQQGARFKIEERGHLVRWHDLRRGACGSH
jgi:hypothetical protein